jgi:hydroxypyruvate isomerase
MSFQLAACAEMLWQDTPMHWRASHLHEMGLPIMCDLMGRVPQMARRARQVSAYRLKTPPFLCDKYSQSQVAMSWSAQHQY